jgi:hypothetical protein
MSDQWVSREFWIPEAQPKYSGLYAADEYEKGVNTVTRDAFAAKKFQTRQECDAWCAANPDPAFVSVQHSFTEQRDELDPRLRIVKINMMLHIPYENDKGFLSDKVALLLREIADFSEKSVREKAEPYSPSPPGVLKVLQTGAFSWEPIND